MEDYDHHYSQGDTSCRGKGPVPLIRFHKVQSMAWSMCKVVGSSSSTGRRRREGEKGGDGDRGRVRQTERNQQKQTVHEKENYSKQNL